MKIDSPICPNCETTTEFRTTKKNRAGDTIRLYICAACSWLTEMIIPKKKRG